MSVSLGQRIDKANRTAFERIINSDPILVDIQPAGERFPEMKENQIFHAGPPIAWSRMTGSAHGAIIGAILYEGLAKNPLEAEKLAASGEIEFSPNHSHGGVGGMTGIITRSTPLYIIENRAYQVTAYSGVLTDRLIFGGYDQKTLDAVRWTNQVFAPALREALILSRGISIKPIQSQAIQMNDEMHNRSNAATSLFVKTMAPYLVEAVGDRKTVADILRFWDQTPSYFTFIGMGACKATMLAAERIEYCSVVSIMSRNGVDFGIQVSGLEDRWFTGPASRINGPMFPGYKYDEAENDIGDSCITETAGVGAFLMAGAPAILRLVGGTIDEAFRYTNEMYEITVDENPNFTIPALDFRGAPAAIDIRLVVETNIVPIIDTAMTHKDPGVGEMIGAGMVIPPMKPFQDALRAFFEKYAG
jgi:Protein of unknown function (DUF1116)